MKLVMDGSGTLRPSVPEVADVRVGEEELIFTNPDGSAGQLRNMYASAHAVIGHRTVTHSVRHPLKGWLTSKSSGRL